MNRRVYTVKDVKSDQIGPLVIASSDDEMLRSLRIAVSDKQSLIGRYPEDFVLLYIGEIDMESGDMSHGNDVLNPYRVGVVADLLGVE